MEFEIILPYDTPHDTIEMVRSILKNTGHKITYTIKLNYKYMADRCSVTYYAESDHKEALKIIKQTQAIVNPLLLDGK